MLERSKDGAKQWAIYRNRWRDAVVFCPDETFKLAERLTTIAILRWCNSLTGSTYVGEATLAAALRTNERTVRRHIKAAVTRGFLVANRRGPVGPSGHPVRTMWPAIDGMPAKEPPPLPQLERRKPPKGQNPPVRPDTDVPLTLPTEL